MRPRRRRAWGSVRNERASAGDLRSDAAPVRAALPRNLAGLLSAGEHSRDGGILVEGVVGSGRDALLSTVAASRDPRDFSREGIEPPASREFVSKVRLLRAGGHWRRAADAGD